MTNCTYLLLPPPLCLFFPPPSVGLNSGSRARTPCITATFHFEVFTPCPRSAAPAGVDKSAAHIHRSSFNVLMAAK